MLDVFMLKMRHCYESCFDRTIQTNADVQLGLLLGLINSNVNRLPSQIRYSDIMISRLDR